MKQFLDLKPAHYETENVKLGQPVLGAFLRRGISETKKLYFKNAYGSYWQISSYFLIADPTFNHDTKICKEPSMTIVIEVKVTKNFGKQNHLQ